VGSFVPLQPDLAGRLNINVALNLPQPRRVKGDLPGLGLVAKAGGNIGDGPDRSVVEASLEADRPEGGKSVLNADPKADFVAQPMPFLHQLTESSAHFDRHHHRLKRWVLYWNRVVEHNHHAVTGVAF